MTMRRAALLRWVVGFTVLTLLLAACGGGEDDPADEATDAAAAAEDTEEPAADDPAEDTEEPAADDAAGDTEEPAADASDEPAGEPASGEPLLIGVVFPTSGPNALLGAQITNTVQLAFDQVNPARPLELRAYDSASDPEAAAREMQRAISQDGVIAVIGPQSTTEATPMKDIATREEVPMIIPAAATPALVEDTDFVFRDSPVTPDLLGKSVDIALAVSDAPPRTAIIHDDGAFALAGLEIVTAAAEEAGLELIGEVEYAAGATDVSGQIVSLIDLDPEFIIHVGSLGADIGLIARQMVENGLTVPVAGLATIPTQDAIEASRGAFEELDGIYWPSSLDTTKPAFEEFEAAYRELYGEEEDIAETMVHAYDAANVLALALDATGGEGGATLAQALRDLEPYDSVSGREGTTIDFAPETPPFTGLTGDYLVVYTLEGGEPTQVEGL
jgi:branched-chain amino acid transport system substrate-binding protein